MEIQVVFIIIFINLTRIFGQNTGSSCELRDNSGWGKCTIFYKCNDPNRARLKICGFDKNTPVVCCPDSAIQSRPPTTSRPDSIATRPPTRRPVTQSSRPPVTNRPNTGSKPTTRRPQSGSNNNRRISEKKCREYAEAVTKYIYALPLQVDPEILVHEVAECDYSNVPFIVGGEEARLGEFPHMAALGFGSRPYDFNCGGSLISERYIMTAAHCMKYGQPKVARLGEHNLERTDDGADPVEIEISEITIHPAYKPPEKYNDIALIKLRREVELNSKIRPACLPISSPSVNSNAVATGWGRINYAEATSPVLLKVSLPVVAEDTCARMWSRKTTSLPRGLDTATMLCAGTLQGGKDACHGDSGGPLTTVNTQNVCVHYVVGVTSFGRYCGLPNSPGVYTRVSHFVPWIESIIWPGQ